MFDTLQPRTSLSEKAWGHIEEAVARFRKAWQQAGPEPVIADYLSPDSDDAFALLIELVGVDLEFRLGTGQKVALEHYFTNHPNLALDRNAVAKLIRHEYQCRRQREADLYFNEYLQRFPDCAGALIEVQPSLKQFGTTVRQEIAAKTTADDPNRTAGYSAVSECPTISAAGSGRIPLLRQLPALPGYEVLSELGHGGMGVVYKARHVKLKRLVAIKMVLADAHASAQTLQRFRLEAEAVAKLQHPHVVQIHEIGEHDGRPFFSLEFVDGGSLDMKVAGTPQPPDEAAALLEKLAGAVHAAHAKGIIHRDLKPGNVMLTLDGEPKVTDFGLAKQLDEDSGQTQTGQVMGTASYMSPEQAAGKISAIGPQSDIWALGAILYEMLTGRPPFKGKNVRDTINQVFTQEPVPPRKLIPEVPHDLETICLKCLQKERRSRYASAQELAEDLRRYRHHEPILARPVSEWVRLWAWCKRNPSLAVTSVVASGALGVVFTFIFLFVSNLSKFQTFDHGYDQARAERAEADAVALREQLAKANNESTQEIATLRRQLGELRRQKDFEEHLRQGEQFMKQENYAAALAEYQAALKLKGDDTIAQTRLEAAQTRLEAENKQLQAEFDELIKQGRAAAVNGQHAAAARAYKAALSIKPDDPTAEILYKQAHAALDKEKADKEKAGRDRDAKFNELMLEGKAALAARRYSIAEQSFQAALNIRPADPSATLRLGEARRGILAEYNQQMQLGKEALEAGKEYTVAVLGGCTSKVPMEKFTASVKAYEQALKLIPNPVAREAFDKASKVLDQHTRFAKHFKAAQDAYVANDFETAKVEYEQAHAIYPHDMTTSNKLLLLKQKKK
ncbi:MAG: protein kinase [Gemmataceae bacterium]